MNHRGRGLYKIRQTVGKMLVDPTVRAAWAEQCLRNRSWAVPSKAMTSLEEAHVSSKQAQGATALISGIEQIRYEGFSSNFLLIVRLTARRIPESARAIAFALQ